MIVSELTSTKPYMIRALHEWCVDNGLTPHLVVAVNAATRVPMAYVKDGEIVLNLSYSATKSLDIGNDAISFSARFNGVSQNLYVPMQAIRGIFARENGQGMFFEVEAEQLDAERVPDAVSDGDNELPKPRKPFLKVIK